MQLCLQLRYWMGPLSSSLDVILASINKHIQTNLQMLSTLALVLDANFVRTCGQGISYSFLHRFLGDMFDFPVIAILVL